MKQFLKLLLISALLLILISSLTQAASVHRVKSGENIHQIARKEGVTTGEIIRLNNLRTPDSIYTGQVLIIPDVEPPSTHRVKAGDTLYKISKKHNIPVKVLAIMNGLTNYNQLYIRQLLYIPAIPGNTWIYKVKAGDTLYKISRATDTSIITLMLCNNINEKDTLNVGQSLKIPVKPDTDSYKRYKNPNYKGNFPETFFLKGTTGEYKVALTFDDGPDGIYTPQILDVLKTYNVPATFFLMGSRINEHPEVVKRIINDGHLIGNHTWSHVNLNNVSEKKFNEEIYNTENGIKDIASVETGLLRPPYGAVSNTTLERLKKMDYKVIYWSVDSRDWYDRNVDQILINTLPDVSRDAIILFHSAGGKGQSLATTVKALPELINTLRMLGYEFVNLDQLLNVEAYS